MSDDLPPKPKKLKVKSAHTLNKKLSISWLLITIVLTFTLSVLISLVTNSVLDDVTLSIAILILFLIIFLGIVFDILGIAVTAAMEAPFHAMNSNRVHGAAAAIWLIRNAEKVSNFCNDVIGDICGIISGAVGTVIVARLTLVYSLNVFIVSLLATGLISSLMVGGKSLGKTFAMNQCNHIVYLVAKLISPFIREKKCKRK